MAYNKYKQFAPAGPDVKTAARFRRRCCKRYVYLDELAVTILVQDDR